MEEKNQILLPHEVFINGIGCISPLKTAEIKGFPAEAPEINEDNFLKCSEPLYKKYIDPMTARRMSRIVKMGIFSARTCLEDAGTDNPGAIITGTGLGCVEDTGKFISSMFANDEKLLNPTPFIQSTHNTVSSQISLMLKCHSYNITYSHRGHSFESALTDVVLMLKEKEVPNVLLGGIDEITPYFFDITNRLGHWKREKCSRYELLRSRTKGSIAGEGSAFFLLSPEANNNSYAKIVSFKTFNNPRNNEDVCIAAASFLEHSGIEAKDIDLVLAGYNGDSDYDPVYDELSGKMFAETACAYFKHLCGEYHTASSFAMWLAAVMLKEQHIPEIVKANNIPAKQLKNILICNHFRNINHTFILLQHVEI